jgi:hypothetical protein
MIIKNNLLPAHTGAVETSLSVAVLDQLKRIQAANNSAPRQAQPEKSQRHTTNLGLKPTPLTKPALMAQKMAEAKPWSTPPPCPANMNG